MDVEKQPPQNTDQDVPNRTGDDMGPSEPLVPASGDTDERDSGPEDETYERSESDDATRERVEH